MLVRRGARAAYARRPRRPRSSRASRRAGSRTSAAPTSGGPASPAQNPLVARAAAWAGARRARQAGRGERKFSQAANDYLTALGLDPSQPEVARARAEASEERAGASVRSSCTTRGSRRRWSAHRGGALAAFREAADVDPSTRRAAAAARVAGGAGAGRPRRGARARRAGGARPRRARRVPSRRSGPRCDARGEQEARRGARWSARSSSTPALERQGALLKKLRWSFLG